MLRLPYNRIAQNGSPFAQSSIDALGISSKNKTELNNFFSELESQRNSLLELLKSQSCEEDQLDKALSLYLANLSHLLIPTGSSTSLKTGFSFWWSDCISGERVVVIKSVEYEILNVLLTVALKKADMGMSSLDMGDIELSSSSASKTFLLYRKAIGMLQYAIEQTQQSEIKCPEKTDIDLEVLTALMELMEAEVQGMTVMRSIGKGNAPSLVSNLAMDAHLKYEKAAADTAGAPDGVFLNKICSYCRYKSACYKSYVLVYHSWTKLSASAGGMAVRLATEAEKVAEQASELGSVYDKTNPQTETTQREAFHQALQLAVKKVKMQSESDNRHVYYERVPDELPELPSPKQLMGSMAYEFPAVSEEVSRSIFEGVKVSESMQSETVIEIISENKNDKADLTVDGIESSDKREEPKSQWWRWVLLIISTPLLLLLTFVGIVVWILLFPLKFFCWPIGFLAQFLWNVVEYLIKAPLNAMKWAAGEPWRPVQPKPSAAENTEA